MLIGRTNSVFRQGEGVMPKVSGEFEVKLQPLAGYASGIEGNQFGRMGLDKSFSGPLTATSQGEMLSVRTATAGSAAYVALEQVDGQLEGKQGSFVMQHTGVMAAGDSQLLLTVVPDSGAGELQGIKGQMQIRIEQGKHFYDFDYDIVAV